MKVAWEGFGQRLRRPVCPFASFGLQRGRRRKAQGARRKSRRKARRKARHEARREARRGEVTINQSNRSKQTRHTSRQARQSGERKHTVPPPRKRGSRALGGVHGGTTPPPQGDGSDSGPKQLLNATPRDDGMGASHQFFKLGLSSEARLSHPSSKQLSNMQRATSL